MDTITLEIPETQLVEWLRRLTPSAVRAAAGPDSGLTGREQEVLRLIAEGLSNRQIAEKLVLSEKTVKTHVSNILSKLNLADRTQAAIYALRNGKAAERG
ncbi:MAG: response regulator transcription factor [Chloroflexi bacterium]|nr:response regulator transcription factor [Chloroflexota bacterium]